MDGGVRLLLNGLLARGSTYNRGCQKKFCASVERSLLRAEAGVRRRARRVDGEGEAKRGRTEKNAPIYLAVAADEKYSNTLNI